MGRHPNPHPWGMTPATDWKFCSIFNLWEHAKFRTKNFEIDMVTEIQCYLTFWPQPKVTSLTIGWKKCCCTPIHVCNSHTKFGWISSNGSGGYSITDRRTDGLTDWDDYNISPSLFIKSLGIIIPSHPVTVYIEINDYRWVRQRMCNVMGQYSTLIPFKFTAHVHISTAIHSSCTYGLSR